jgi:hypothetical protein
MNGCLEKLETSILQIQRLSNHQNELLAMAISNFVNPNVRDQVFRGSEISSDFESLLLQSRGALDRLTSFITGRYGKGSYTDRFSKLRNTVGNSKRDVKTNSILSILDNAKWFEGKLVEDKLQENLRSFVAHKQSISERLETYFQVHRINQDQFLLYDMVSKGFPFFKTSYEMGKTLSYVILNTVALFTTGQVLEPSHYNPNWKNRSVVLSDFENISSEQLRIPVVSKMTLSGFDYTEKDVAKEILTDPISFTIALPKQVKDLRKSGWTEIGKLSNGRIAMVT